MDKKTGEKSYVVHVSRNMEAPETANVSCPFCAKNFLKKTFYECLLRQKIDPSTTMRIQCP